MPNVRYQVFVSSTWDDLKQQRRAVTWSLLKAHHIPVGMESFPATDDRGWEIIQRSIDESDYYVLIVAHRYGSLVPGQEERISWTHREYRYAKSKGIPVVAFLIDENAPTPPSNIEGTAKGRRLLAAFKKEVSEEHKWNIWKNEDHLCHEIIQAVNYAIKTGDQRPGWYRGPLSDTPRMSDEAVSIDIDLPSDADGNYVAKHPRVDAYDPDKTAPEGFNPFLHLQKVGIVDSRAVEFRNRMAVVPWSVVNSGPPTGRLVVELSCSNCSSISLTEPKPPIRGLSSRPRLADSKLSPHVEVGDHDVRQVIPDGLVNGEKLTMPTLYLKLQDPLEPAKLTIVVRGQGLQTEEHVIRREETSVETWDTYNGKHTKEM